MRSTSSWSGTRCPASWVATSQSRPARVSQTVLVADRPARTVGHRELRREPGIRGHDGIEPIRSMTMSSPRRRWCHIPSGPAIQTLPPLTSTTTIPAPGMRTTGSPVDPPLPAEPAKPVPA